MYDLVEVRELSTRELIGTWVPFGKEGDAFLDSRDGAGMAAIYVGAGFGCTECRCTGVEVGEYPGEPGTTVLTGYRKG